MVNASKELNSELKFHNRTKGIRSRQLSNPQGSIIIQREEKNILNLEYPHCCHFSTLSWLKTAKSIRGRLCWSHKKSRAQMDERTMFLSLSAHTLVTSAPYYEWKMQEKSRFEGNSVDPTKGAEPRWVRGWAKGPGCRVKPPQKWLIRQALWQAKAAVWPLITVL